MTPLEFANQYLQMDVFIYPLEDPTSGPSASQGDWQHVKMDDYRLGASPYVGEIWQDIATHLDQPLSVKIKNIQGDIQDVTLTRNQLQQHFHYPFVGKGSPEQGQIALQLLYRYHKTKFSLDDLLAENFIGLDCNGFVGNYLQRVVQGHDWTEIANDKDPGPTTLIGDLLQAQGSDSQVKSMDGLEPDGTYLLGLCDEDGVIKDPSKANPTNWGHIMITEPGTLDNSGPCLQVGVTEATATGSSKLRNLTYSIVGTTDGSAGTVFQILRGSPDQKMNVRIARVNMS